MVKTNALGSCLQSYSRDSASIAPQKAPFSPLYAAFTILGVSCLPNICYAQSTAVHNVPEEQRSFIRALSDLSALVPSASSNAMNTVQGHIDNIQRCSHSGPSDDSYALENTGVTCELNDFNRLRKVDAFVSSTLERGSYDINAPLPDGEDKSVDFDGTILSAGLRYNLSQQISLGVTVSRYLLSSGNLRVSNTEFTSAAQTEFSRTGLSAFINYTPRQSPWYANVILERGNYQFEGSRTQPGHIDEKTAIYIQDYSITRTGGDELSAQISVGLLKQIDTTRLKAYTSVGYSDINIDGYRENLVAGSNDALISGIDNLNMQLSNLSAGAEVSWAIKGDKSIFSPSIALEWIQDKLDHPVSANGYLTGEVVNAPLYYQSAESDDSYMVGSIGVHAAYRNGFSGYVSLSTQAAHEGFESEQISAGGRWRF